MTLPISPQSDDPTDALLYWLARRDAATNTFDRNRAEFMVKSIERERKVANGEPVEVVRRRNYYGGWSRRAR